jgi:hypothetical protein
LTDVSIETAPQIAGTGQRTPQHHEALVARSLLLAITAAWFLAAAMARLEDSVTSLISLGQRLAFGFALLALALVDWRGFRRWWLVIGLVAVAVIWAATGHPLLFLVGGY